MLSKEETFNVWAPPSAIWTPWVKPVVFSQIDSATMESQLSAPPIQTDWEIAADGVTAIVVELPGDQGISLALHLVARGYRPVPLYNACPQPMGSVAVVDVPPIMAALAASAEAIGRFILPPDAPPAFLLDVNRNPAIAVTPGMFDNRSISLPTDFPSANFLQSRGIERVVLIQASAADPAVDLSHTLLRWQEAGLGIYRLALNETGPPQTINIERPKAYRALWYNFLAKLGLRPSPLGGFGGHLPMPSSG